MDMMRTSRPSGRPPQDRPVERPAANEQRHPEVAPRYEEPKRGRKKPLIIGGIIALVILVAAIAGYLIWSNRSTEPTAIDNNKYQAVFFTNGQVYFGKLQPFNNDYLKLTDIYYLQTQNSTGGEAASSNPQEAAKTDQGSVQLIKLGDEIHGPEDEMVISKDQVLFYENLKTDSKVVQSIDKQKNS